jgi:regulatory protein
VRIESVREGASGTAIVAAGGSSFIVRVDQLEGLGLAATVLVAGTELDETAEGLLRLAAEMHEAERRGLALLARAEQSAFMLRAKLELRGFSERAVRAAIDRLATQGFLDDRRFASAYAASRLSRRVEGPRSLAAALRSRGLDAQTVKEAVAAAFGPEERSAMLLKAIVRERKRCGGDEERFQERLRDLGYRGDEVREALSRLDEGGEAFT